MFNFNWKMDGGYPAPGIKYHGANVFGIFICGGGSTMGYKLAGFNHLGGVEIDAPIGEVYQTNHKPKHFYLQDIREFVSRTDLPEELYSLDILDGSPPCSSFSMSGNREDDWGKEKKFREGQTNQTLDDLFFDFIRLGKKLQPKIIIAENVRGLISGNAKAYVREIIQAFKDAGYMVQLFLLNAASMGVPQTRERVFFICRRNDLNLPRLVLSFKEAAIPYSVVDKIAAVKLGKPLTETYTKWWNKCKSGTKYSSAHPEGSFFNTIKLSPDKVCPTISSTEAGRVTHYEFPNDISNECIGLCGSFPRDYNYLNQQVKYIIGMSVPPVMTAQVAHQVYKQWISKWK